MKYISTIAATAVITCLLTNGVRDVMNVQQTGKVGQKVNGVVKLLKEKYLFDIDEEKMADYAATGILASLDEPYTHYYDKESFNSYFLNIVSGYTGVGISMAFNANTEEVSIVSVYEDSPAQRSGILPGDIIKAFNGENINSSNYSDIVGRMRGNDDNINETITLTIVRKNSEPFDVSIKREYIEKKTVSSKMLDDNTAYIRISEFMGRNRNNENSISTYDEFKNHFTECRDKGMTQLVLDLRDNPGGDIDIAMKIADEFLPHCTMAHTVNKSGKTYNYISDDNMSNVNLAVLVNGNSASAAEAVTAALKTQKRAVIVGTKTYGKGIVQAVIQLADGSGMSVTTSKYYTEDGVEIHKVGIEPDVIVDMQSEKLVSQLTTDQDIQLTAALNELKKTQ